MSGYWTGILTVLAINIVMAYAIFLPVATGQLNLGGAGFQAVGAYTAAYICGKYGATIWLTIPAAMLSTALVSFLIAFPLLRTKGVYLVLATFAFAEVISGAILNSEALGGAMGLSVPVFVDYQVPVAAALIVTLVTFYLMATRFGLIMRAAHDDDVVTDLMGANVRGIRVAAFTIGGAFAGLAGALYAHSFSFVDIQGFNALVSIYVLLYVLLGGTQTAWGPLVGATFFTMLPEALRVVLPAAMKWITLATGSSAGNVTIDDSWRFVILGSVTVLMMIFRPEGVITRVALERFRRRSGITSLPRVEPAR